MDFYTAMKKTLNESESNVSYTENGAKGYRTTGSTLLDINFKVPSMRTMREDEINKLFTKAYSEDPRLAILWAFYAGDVRGGLGERRLFRILESSIASFNPKLAVKLLKLVPEYTRWDNIFTLYNRRDTHDAVIELIKDQLAEDMTNMADKKPISLLAKWMPSINTSSVETRKLGKKIANDLNLTPRQYRKLMSKMREYLKVVEVQMSAGKWSEIDYEAVPSMANLKYKNAFLKNDEDRRRAYLESLTRGESTVNAEVAFPCDIVHKYMYNSYRVKDTIDKLLEGMWKALPNYVKDASNTIVVADGSGSMTQACPGTNMTPLEVANSLAIYFSERCSEPYKGKYITFSENPQYVNFPANAPLQYKLTIAQAHDEIANTNIEAVFTLILETAIKFKVDQKDIPNILIISDMEFDDCATSGSNNSHDPWYAKPKLEPRLFKAIETLYRRHGYKLPKLAFWNVASRTNTIPVRENELGVTLVSGYSPAICEMVLSNKTDPFEVLKEKLESERYAPVNEIITSVFNRK